MNLKLLLLFLLFGRRYLVSDIKTFDSASECRL